MSRLAFCFLFGFLSLAALAEYQVFSYRSSIVRPLPHLTLEDRDVSVATSLGNDVLDGYLVTVCCYPCNASFGKAYPSWLYVLRASDKKRVLWQVPVRIDGGIFGRRISTDVIYDKFFRQGIFYDDDIFRRYAKRANKSWFAMDFAASMTYPSVMSRGGKLIHVDAGLLGDKTAAVRLHHVGYGVASWKFNELLAPWKDFNPYIASASGTITGSVSLEGFSFDPSNYDRYDVAPVAGFFTIRFNKHLTTLIDGIDDWDAIDDIIQSRLQFNSIIKEDALPEFDFR